MAKLSASKSIHHRVSFFTSRGAGSSSAQLLPICYAMEHRQVSRRATASATLARQPCLSLNSGGGFLRRTFYTFKGESMADQKEPYVSQADRPEVKIDPDKPVSELRVRD